MSKKRWLILIAAFFMIEGLILVSNRVFYNQMKNLETTAQSDRALFETSETDVVEKAVKRPVDLAALPNDPLAPMPKRSKEEKKFAPDTGPEKIYDVGIQTGILIQ